MTHARGKGRFLPLALAVGSLAGLAIFAWPELARGPRLGARLAARSEPSSRPPSVLPLAAVAAAIHPAESAGAAPDGAPAEPEHPHPITARHQRIFRENELIAALNGALDARDGAGLRRLLDDYRREFPDDPNQLSAGYQLIADCLDHLDARSRAAAQRYYDEERGSTLRRMVARVCFEPADPAH